MRVCQVFMYWGGVPVVVTQFFIFGHPGVRLVYGDQVIA